MADTQRATLGVDPSIGRRALDVILATIALLVLLAPMLLVALAIKVTSRGPVLFAQTRVGQGGRGFKILKFRTMRHGAGGSALTCPGDSRITRVGRVLRATCIDELPQLLNVLAGQMTLVGPRPQTPGFAAQYPSGLRGIFRYRPGLTGPGVVRFNDDDVLPPGTHTSEQIEEYYLRLIVPRRVAADYDFCKNATVRKTIRVLWDTAMLAPHRLIGRKVEPQQVVAIPDLAADGTPVPAYASHRAENREDRAS